MILEQRNGLVGLFDLDGTLADYDTAMTRDIKLLLPPDYQDWRSYQDQDFIKNLIKLIRSQPGWWTRLARLEDGFLLLALMKELGFNLNILTKGPYNHPNSWSEKVIWCKENVPDIPITVTEDKSLVYGKVLVDDYPPYIIGWLEHRPRGMVIMPDRAWNEGFEHPQVIRYKKNLSEISERLKLLFNA